MRAMWQNKQSHWNGAWGAWLHLHPQVTSRIEFSSSFVTSSGARRDQLTLWSPLKQITAVAEEAVLLTLPQMLQVLGEKDEQVESSEAGWAQIRTVRSSLCPPSSQLQIIKDTSDPFLSSLLTRSTPPSLHPSIHLPPSVSPHPQETSPPRVGATSLAEVEQSTTSERSLQNKSFAHKNNHENATKVCFCTNIVTLYKTWCYNFFKKYTTVSPLFALNLRIILLWNFKSSLVLFVLGNMSWFDCSSHYCRPDIRTQPVQWRHMDLE